MFIILDLYDSMCNMDIYYYMYKNCLVMYMCNEVCEIKEYKFKKRSLKIDNIYIFLMFILI